MSSLLASATALAVVVMIRRRLSRERPIRLGRQWVLLAMCLLITAIGFQFTRPSLPIWRWSAAAMVFGSIFWCLRARTIVLSLDETGRLVQRLPVHAFAVVAIIVCVRPVLRGLILSGPGATDAHSDLVVLAFALGTIVGGRIELTIRAFRLRRPLRNRSRNQRI